MLSREVLDELFNTFPEEQELIINNLRESLSIFVVDPKS